MSATPVLPSAPATHWGLFREVLAVLLLTLVPVVPVVPLVPVVPWLVGVALLWTSDRRRVGVS